MMVESARDGSERSSSNMLFWKKKKYILASHRDDEKVSTTVTVKINGDSKGSKINHLYEETMCSDRAYVTYRVMQIKTTKHPE